MFLPGSRTPPNFLVSSQGSLAEKVTSSTVNFLSSVLSATISLVFLYHMTSILNFMTEANKLWYTDTILRHDFFSIKAIFVFLLLCFKNSTFPFFSCILSWISVSLNVNLHRNSINHSVCVPPPEDFILVPSTYLFKIQFSSFWNIPKTHCFYLPNRIICFYFSEMKATVTNSLLIFFVLLRIFIAIWTKDRGYSSC